MRIQRTTASGITYQASFKKAPSQRTLEALDAIARAAIEHITPVPSSPAPHEPTPEELSDARKPD